MLRPYRVAPIASPYRVRGSRNPAAGAHGRVGTGSARTCVFRIGSAVLRRRGAACCAPTLFHAPLSFLAMTDPSIRTPLRAFAGRRSIRLPSFDYRQPGSYFITICTKNRAPLLGGLVGRAVRLSPAGHAVQRCWLDIPRHFSRVTLDAFVIMPDHVHGILRLGVGGADVGAQHATPLLGTIIGSFKSAATRSVNLGATTPGAALWQRNFFEHVIRDERSLQRIRWYIALNPARRSTKRSADEASRPGAAPGPPLPRRGPRERR